MNLLFGKGQSSDTNYQQLLPAQGNSHAMLCCGENNVCLTNVISTDNLFNISQNLSAFEQVEIELFQICAALVSG